MALEGKNEDSTMKQRENILTAIAGATPELLGKVLEILVKSGVGKTNNQASA